MSAQIQSFISDFLHRRDISDSDGYALKAANSVDRLSDWDHESITRALSRPNTELFLRNPRVKKKELLSDLADRILTHCKIPISNNPKSTCDVLFLAANPLNSDRLAIDEEIRDITEKIRKAEHREYVTLQSAWAVRPDDLLQILNEQNPEILHFSGHGGGPSGLALSDDQGNEKLIQNDALTSLFRTLKGNIRVVLLNACYSEDQGNAIVKYVDCVIGMKDSIGDEAARIFAASFYRAIVFGCSIHDAFNQALTALKLENTGEEDIPILLVRKGIDPAKIILIKPENS